ncbi:hypothetical protein B0H17DRAFT_1140838 [Mycena rosella]|uniref:Uncharacterized protein n=1 Tax=Mycena rosella TaxID=1033263 RepID=A0AAD7G9R4_MYCRO|nr:hypothetical protein B0H17DRAFT_1140838 [Mycena rosella]
MAHPPMKFKYLPGPTDYELKKHAELKAQPLEEQQLAAERSRSYQATYREKNRNDLRISSGNLRTADKRSHGHIIDVRITVSADLPVGIMIAHSASTKLATSIRAGDSWRDIHQNW